MNNPAVDAIKSLQSRNADEMKAVEEEMDRAFKIANALRDRYEELNRMDDDYNLAISALENPPMHQMPGPVPEEEEPYDTAPQGHQQDYDQPETAGLMFKRVRKGQ